MSDLEPALPEVTPADIQGDLAAALARIEILEGRLDMVERSLNEQAIEDISVDDLKAVDSDSTDPEQVLVIDDLL